MKENKLIYNIIAKTNCLTAPFKIHNFGKNPKNNKPLAVITFDEGNKELSEIMNSYNISYFIYKTLKFYNSKFPYIIFPPTSKKQ